MIFGCYCYFSCQATWTAATFWWSATVFTSGAHSPTCEWWYWTCFNTWLWWVWSL